MSAILLNGSKVTFHLDPREHRLDQVLEPVAAHVAEGSFGVVFIVCKVFTLSASLVASLLSVDRFFIDCLLLEQLGLLGLNSKS